MVNVEVRTPMGKRRTLLKGKRGDCVEVEQLVGGDGGKGKMASFMEEREWERFCSWDRERHSLWIYSRASERRNSGVCKMRRNLGKGRLLKSRRHICDIHGDW